MSPTGYTAKLHAGEQSFPDFVLGCARAFGALIAMRDAPNDAPIPDGFAPDAYYEKSVESARARLAELRAMTPSDAEEAARKYYELDAASGAANKASRELRRARYEAMLAKVREWVPPTEDHAELKNFMIQQIQESVRFDCDYTEPTPVPKSGSEWLAERTACAKESLERAIQARDEEIERCRKRTAWVKALRDSLAVAR